MKKYKAFYGEVGMMVRFMAWRRMEGLYINRG